MNSVAWHKHESNKKAIHVDCLFIRLTTIKVPPVDPLAEAVLGRVAPSAEVLQSECLLLEVAQSERQWECQ